MGVSLSGWRETRIGRAAKKFPHWCRVVMDRDIHGFISGLPSAGMSAIEISGAAHGHRPFKSYRSLAYPEFDVCNPSAVEPADLVFCEQVLEHVEDPVAAIHGLRKLAAPGGHVIVSTPFMIRVHREPQDLWRFTADGLQRLLRQGGFECVRVRSWGNRACMFANSFFWFPYIPGLCPLGNDDAVPLVVWAIARRS